MHHNPTTTQPVVLAAALANPQSSPEPRTPSPNYPYVKVAFMIRIGASSHGESRVHASVVRRGDRHDARDLTVACR